MPFSIPPLLNTASIGQIERLEHRAQIRVKSTHGTTLVGHISKNSIFIEVFVPGIGKVRKRPGHEFFYDAKQLVRHLRAKSYIIM